MLAISLALLASLGWGAGGIFARLGLQHVSPTTGTMVSLAVGAFVTLIIAAAWRPGEIAALGGVALACILLVAVFNFLLGRLLNYTATRLVGLSVASPMVGASPLFSTVLAVLILGETVTPIMVLGTVSIVGGVGLILSQR